MPRISIDLTTEMFNVLRRFTFDNNMPTAVYVRELIRRDLESQLSIELNDNIGEPGKPATLGIGVRSYRSVTEAKQASAFNLPAPNLPKPRIDLAKGISKLLDQPSPPANFTELCQSVIGASLEEIMEALGRLGKQVSREGIIS